jgi:hypothetical protein
MSGKDADAEFTDEAMRSIRALLPTPADARPPSPCARPTD